jgi:hypothetical protein
MGRSICTVYYGIVGHLLFSCTSREFFRRDLFSDNDDTVVSLIFYIWVIPEQHQKERDFIVGKVTATTKRSGGPFFEDVEMR